MTQWQSADLTLVIPYPGVMTCAIPALERQKQRNCHDFEVCLGYLARPQLQAISPLAKVPPLFKQPAQLMTWVFCVCHIVHQHFGLPFCFLTRTCEVNAGSLLTRSQLAQADLELQVLLPPPHTCQDYRLVPPCLVAVLSTLQMRKPKSGGNYYPGLQEVQPYLSSILNSRTRWFNMVLFLDFCFRKYGPFPASNSTCSSSQYSEAGTGYPEVLLAWATQ